MGAGSIVSLLRRMSVYVYYWNAVFGGSFCGAYFRALREGSGGAWAGAKVFSGEIFLGVTFRVIHKWLKFLERNRRWSSANISPVGME